MNIQDYLSNLSQKDLIDRLDMALKGANLGIWDWDLRDNSVQFDRRWCEMLGLKFEETPMQLSSWETRVHPEDLKQCYQDIQRYLNGDTPFYENVHRMKHSDGSWHYILDRGRLSGWDENGKPIRFTGTHLDVTEIEVSKRKVQADYRQLFEMVKEMPSAIAMFDKDICYLAHSARWLTDYGLEGQNIIGKSHYDIFPDIPDHWKKIHQRVAQGESIHNDRDIFEREDGSRIYLKWSMRPWYSAPGEIGGVVMLTENITKAVEAAQVAEHANKMAALGEMASGVAHEINNPLAIISGKLQVLKLKMLERNVAPADLQPDIDSTIAACERIASIVIGMKNLSQHGENSIPEKWDLKSIVSDVINLSRGRLKAHNVRFLEATESHYVFCNPTQVGQIVLNLLNNAIDATSDLSNKWIRLEMRAVDKWFVVSVTDSGQGIPEQIVKKIFDPFYTTKTAGKGTGLGLSISKNLAQANGACLEYDPSSPNTCFILKFPL